jgi:hypothetical protein
MYIGQTRAKFQTSTIPDELEITVILKIVLELCKTFIMASTHYAEHIEISNYFPLILVLY